MMTVEATAVLCTPWRTNTSRVASSWIHVNSVNDLPEVNCKGVHAARHGKYRNKPSVRSNARYPAHTRQVPGSIARP